METMNQQEGQSHQQDTPQQQAPQENQMPPSGDNKNAIAVLCYLGILVIIPLLTAKEDPFVKYHIKQGLVLLIAFVILSAIAIIPILGWIIAPIGWIVGIIFMIMGIINVLNGKTKPLPLIGQYADKFAI